MQHGSFTRTRDIERERAVFDLDDAQVEQLAAGTATLADLLGTAPDESAIIRAAVAGFSRALGLHLERGELTSVERELATEFEGDTLVRVRRNG